MEEGKIGQPGSQMAQCGERNFFFFLESIEVHSMHMKPWRVLSCVCSDSLGLVWGQGVPGDADGLSVSRFDVHISSTMSLHHRKLA